MRVPQGFEIEAVPGGWVVARAGGAAFVADAVRRWGSLYAFAQSAGGEALRGRVAARVVAAPGGEWVVRHYSRGGWVAPLLGDRYLRVGVPRPVRESWVSEGARARGVATPEVCAFVVHPRGAFYRADLATARIPGSVDLAELSLGSGRPGEAERVEAWRAAGRLLRLVFAAGLVHSDVNLRNIVVTQPAGAAATAHLLDLDGGRLVRRPSPRHVHVMLQRLHRSRLKLEARYGREVGEAALAAFQESLDG